MTTRSSRIGTILLVAALGLAIVASVGASPGTALVDGIPQRGTILGQKTAVVTLLQFEDLACTHCGDYDGESFSAILDEALGR